MSSKSRGVRFSIVDGTATATNATHRCPPAPLPASTAIKGQAT
ncbi:hypothetical protein [Microtetraspora malaysiensis]